MTPDTTRHMVRSSASRPELRSGTLRRALSAAVAVLALMVLSACGEAEQDGGVASLDVDVDVDDRDRFAVGTEVTVVLPGGNEVAGTISATAVVEVRPENGDPESMLEVEIALEEQAPDEFVGAPVDVVVAVDERTDVLLVPVNALLALAEGGGYGLEVVAGDGGTSIVALEIGLFAEGTVEISSDEVAEGTVVGVAGR